MKCYTLSVEGKLTAGLPAQAPLVAGNDEPFRHVKVGSASLPISKSVDMGSGRIDGVCYRLSQSGRSVIFAPGGGSAEQAGACMVYACMPEDAGAYAGNIKDGPESRWRNVYLAKVRMEPRPFQDGEAWMQASGDETHEAFAAMLAYDAAENIALLCLQPGAYVSVVVGGKTVVLLDWDGAALVAHKTAAPEKVKAAPKTKG